MFYAAIMDITNISSVTSIPQYALIALTALIAAFLIVFALTLIGLHIYVAWALHSIGKKLGVKPSILAWIPIVNLFYIPMLAGYRWYFGFFWILATIPILGLFVILILMIWWWIRIAKRLNFPSYYGILMAIPLINLIVLAILAWTKKKKPNYKKK